MSDKNNEIQIAKENQGMIKSTVIMFKENHFIQQVQEFQKLRTYPFYPFPGVVQSK